MNAHTPGPWAVEPAIGRQGETYYLQVMPPVVLGHYRGGVASIHDAENIDGITVAEAAANARLIAAAPDLLDALYEALEFVTDQVDVVDGPDGQPMANDAMNLDRVIRAAIAKATGSGA